MNSRLLRIPKALVLLVAIALGACGGGGDDSGADNGSGAADARGGGDAPGPDSGATAPGPAAEVRACAGATGAPPAGSCTMTPGSAALLVRGDLLLPGTVVEGGELLIVGGAIACADCGCASSPEAAGASILDCSGHVLSPGLINAHDHISFTEMAPAITGDERFVHRHEWRKGLNGHGKIPTKGNSHRLGDAWGEMRQVIAGTTSLFGSGGEAGMTRNLDRAQLLEGMSHDRGIYSTFPLGDSGGALAEEGCGRYDFDDSDRLEAPAYVPHVAEGIAVNARNEFLCLAGQVEGSVDYVVDQAAFIHGIGLTSTDIALMAGDGTGLVWSPRSNTVLYGNTAQAPVYDRLGVQIALGTDWTASGSVHMLRELECAEHWNATYWDGYFSDADLVAMATHDAAELLGFGDVLGSLVAGKAADVVVWDGSQRDGWRAVLDAEPSDVVLVVRGGLALYGDDALMDGLTGPGVCETLDVCGRAKRICAERELGVSADQLQSEMDPGTYGLVHCGVPTDEPTCVASRPGEYTGVPTAGDMDADGLPDASDVCPQVFDPVRPLDNGQQPDADGDGQGDACDPCPFDANTTACTSIDPRDIDGDGVAAAVDNCAGASNPDQADGDQDGVGDVCDACPQFANPAGSGCPRTIYEIKRGEVPEGASALVLSAVVTAAADDAFFVAVEPTDAGWQGPEFSGLYVFHGGSVQAAVGARIKLDGKVSDYFGQTQMSDATVEILDPAAGVPAPLEINPADAAPGGAKADAYEALLVRVSEVTVLDTSPTGQEGETVAGEFLVTGNLSVDDALFTPVEPITEGQTLGGITGVLRFNWGRNKLLPRSADDIDLGAATLRAFGPEHVYVYASTTGATSPPLEVTLSGPADRDIFVSVTSSNAPVVSAVANGTSIRTGERTAAVHVTGGAPGGPVTLTADLDGTQRTAQVTVLALDATPKVERLTATPATLAPGETAEVEVVLDIPAPPAGQQVEIQLRDVGGVTAPPQVLVRPKEFSIAFQVTAGTSTGTLEITAIASGGSASTAIEIAERPLVGLVLSEVFFDPTGQDERREWVKLYNGSGAAIDLSGYSLGYGGNDYTWGRFQLNGTVPAGGCVIVGGPDGDAQTGSPSFDVSEDFDPDIQNSGDRADGIAVFDVSADRIGNDTAPLDVVIYGERNESDLIGPDGRAVSEPHAAKAPSGQSLIRTGIDTWGHNPNPNDRGCFPVP